MLLAFNSRERKRSLFWACHAVADVCEDDGVFLLSCWVFYEYGFARWFVFVTIVIRSGSLVRNPWALFSWNRWCSCAGLRLHTCWDCVWFVWVGALIHRHLGFSLFGLSFDRFFLVHSPWFSCFVSSQEFRTCHILVYIHILTIDILMFQTAELPGITLAKITFARIFFAGSGVQWYGRSLSAMVNQSCPRVTFLGPDPTRPAETLTRPDPTRDCRQKSDPTRPDPLPDPSLICIVFNWIIIFINLLIIIYQI